MDTLGIIGYGRMGETLFRLLEDDFDVCAYDRQPLSVKAGHGPRFVSLEEAASSPEVLLCVPVLKFAEAVAEVKPFVAENACVLDVCSIKTYPAEILGRNFAPSNVLPTHPMFGPDSTQSGFEGRTMVLCPENAGRKLVDRWSSVFARKGLKVVEMTCAEHDKIMASSLCLTQLIGRALKDFDLSSEIETDNVRRLREIRDITCRDSLELFEGLHRLNPYASEERRRFRENLDQLEALLAGKKGAAQ
jgi:prephenate dehydrogenase